MRPGAWLLLIFLCVLGARLLQHDLLWVEEGYPTAAAIQLLDGKTLYRDVWFDKPPLFAGVYLLWGAQTGFALRVAGALFVFACCAMLYRFARDMWGEREGIAAAALLAFFLTFGIPAAVMALAPDLLMILPHIAAIYFAWRGRAFWSGAMAGIAMLVNSKAAFVLAACAFFQYRSLPLLLAGFAVPNAIAAVWMALNGSLAAYWQQVWVTGFVYSRDTFIANPVLEGVKRSLSWVGFQAAIVAGAVCTLWRERSRPLMAWIIVAFAGVLAGSRFFPRYYFLLLPPFCLLAARAFATSRNMRIAIAALLIIPAVRFGPRLADHSRWADTAMMEDSRRAAALINARKQPDDTLLVWGYRPDIFAFTRMKAGARFLDSQPLTGVFADRHLTHAKISMPELAIESRRELTTASPTFIADGLGPYNASLAITSYPDLAAWLAGYHEIARTPGAIIYERSR